MRTPKCYRRSNVMSDNSLKKFKSTYEVILGKYEALWKKNSCFQLSQVTKNNSYACVNHVCLYVRIFYTLTVVYHLFLNQCS